MTILDWFLVYEGCFYNRLTYYKNHLHKPKICKNSKLYVLKQWKQTRCIYVPE